VQPKFALGKCVITPAARDALGAAGIIPSVLLGRHVAGDWGDLTEEDRQANESALIDGERLLSAYQLADDLGVWVITEGDRLYTTILLPEEY